MGPLDLPVHSLKCPKVSGDHPPLVVKLHRSVGGQRVRTFFDVVSRPFGGHKFGNSSGHDPRRWSPPLFPKKKNGQKYHIRFIPDSTDEEVQYYREEGAEGYLKEYDCSRSYRRREARLTVIHLLGPSGSLWTGPVTKDTIRLLWVMAPSEPCV